MDEIPIEKVIRSRRRTVSLEVTPHATLVVRAPHRVPASFIEEMISEKRSWILRKMEEMRKRPALFIHEYVEGELFFFLGRPYPLHIVDDGGPAIERTDRLCVSRTLLPDIRNRLKRWFMQEAHKEIHARCMWFSMKTGHVPAAIRITDARQRWGSCTHKGGLNFSWRLIQAPPEIVDYVVVHELVHISQHDHSGKFWAKVREIMPDYERRREWLRDNERLLRI
jgi:predicted metal-dependent hydrolase